MAKDDERPQFNPKHRIAGAIILVSLAVIFVPMFLDETSPPPENQSLTEIPNRDAEDTRVVVTPVEPSDAASAPATQIAAAEPLPEAPVAAATVVEATAKPTPVKVGESETAPVVKAVERSSQPTAKPKPVVAKPSDIAEKISRGWVVQVGTFSNLENAGHLRERLSSKGFAVDSESLTLDGKKAMRLRVGPYRDKAAAARAQAKIEKDFSINGMVRAYP